MKMTIHKLRFAKESKGSMGIVIYMVVIILLTSFLLTGGLFSKPSADENAEKFILLPDLPIDKHSSLQLRSLKFGSCNVTTAVDFLVDRSGSMTFGTKLENQQSALREFGNKFPDEGILGMQTFSTTPTSAVPIDYFKNIKTVFFEAISNLNPVGGTSTKDAFVFAKTKLDAARLKFPDHKFAMIFISDGIPETYDTNVTCPGGPDSRYCTVNPRDSNTCRCFDVGQDPTSVASEIKNSGVRIFSIRYLDPFDSKFQDDLKTLMDNVATTPSDSYTVPSNEQITDILSEIAQKLCE